MRVAIQGQDGSFHAEAARQFFGDTITLVPCMSFPDVFDAYNAHDADALIAAVENTIYGSINQVYQLIESCPAPIIGEVKLPVAQQLIGVPDTNLDNITAIYSHPVALAQCRQTLAAIAPQAELVEFFDTAGAVEFVRDSDDPTIAAVAGRGAASLYGLPIIRSDVNDSPHNITRFVALSSTLLPESDQCNRASLVITTNHQPGALVEVLQLFAHAGINLAKLQSQPIVDMPWHYKFFVVADATPAELAPVLEAISATGHTVTSLGYYPRAHETQAI